ncbi:MAG: hypothetical protein WHV28_09600 [Bacteroidota bacterium]
MKVFAEKDEIFSVISKGWQMSFIFNNLETGIIFANPKTRRKVLVNWFEKIGEGRACITLGSQTFMFQNIKFKKKFKKI